MSGQHIDTLKDVKLYSKKDADITTSPVSIQELNKSSLQKLNSVSVADAVKYFSGVMVRDYGGIGGLKTISVRGLGVNHTGVLYDGMMVSDAQGGQIDLGRFSLDNIESIQLINAQPTGMLLPARSYSSASVLSLVSTPSFSPERLVLKLKAGSFGFFNPSLTFGAGNNKNFSHRINAEYQSAHGKYPFIDYESGSIKRDRINSDIRNYRIEYDAELMSSDSSKIKFKAYYYNSRRGLPGSVVLYNDLSNERLNNSNFFSQASWLKDISQKSSIQLRVKYSLEHKYYLDLDYPNDSGRLENDFRQQELYFSGAYRYQFTKSLSASYAADYFHNKLRRTDIFSAGFPEPSRDNVLNNLAFNFHRPRLEASANVLYSAYFEKVKTGIKPEDMQRFTPAFSVSVQPAKSLPLRIRAFYKDIYRVPTFDDLYFTNIGNRGLKPESVKQYNLGISIHQRSEKHLLRKIIFTADAYYNSIKDRILAVPRNNLFQWSMMNVGKVEIKAIDASLHLELKPVGDFIISSSANYSLQNVMDVSDPQSSLYKTQLPYTPKHSGSFKINTSYKNLDFNYNILYSSSRYRLGDQLPVNFIRGWSTSDVSASYKLNTTRRWNYRVTAELNNLFNQQYEVIKYYPMPGFNWRLGIIAVLNK